MRQSISRPVAYDGGEQLKAEHSEKTLVSASTRLHSIDIVRGWAMLTMLLTHSANEISGVNYRSAYRWDEFAPVYMNSLQDWIGFVIGIAAPAFFILLGFGMALFVESRKKRNWTEWEITRFLTVRGCIFIAIEQLILNWQFSTLHYYPYVGVLATMGITLIMLALIRRLNVWVVASIGVAVLLTVQAYYYFVGQPTDYILLRSILVAPSSSPFEAITVTFPVLGWFPIVVLGYVAGRLIAEKRIKLRRFSLLLGCALLTVFLIVRVANGYGNLYDGHFFAFTKVPPSLVYLLFYSGVVFLMIWGYTYYKSGFVGEILILFGQTSLLFYVLHEEFILNLLGRIVSKFSYAPITLTFISATLAAIILYFLCYRYRDLRRKYPDSVLKYF